MTENKRVVYIHAGELKESNAEEIGEDEYICIGCRQKFEAPPAYLGIEPPDGYVFGGWYCGGCIRRRGPNRLPVQSSNLLSIGYKEEQSLLEVQFKGGSIYRYFDVPQETYAGLMAAPSRGKYFHANIKKAGFEFEKIIGG